MENTNLKSPPEDSEPDSPNPIQPTKPLSFSNGVLKLRTPHAPHVPPYDPHAPHVPPYDPHAPFSPSMHNEHSKHHAPPHAPGTYMECLKNHAAAMGGNAIDGCGEYMPSTTSLLCAACGCHRNFHRLSPRAASFPHAPPHHHLPLLEYRPHRRHRPSPPRSPSPPPISSSYMLLSLSSPNPNHNNVANPNVGGGNNNNNSKKRFRTRFTPVQKEKMYELAERLTWKMQRRDEEMISGFCERIGVEKGVFKVWMHNNKNTRGKKDAVSVNEVVSKGNGIDLHDYRDNTNHNSNSDEVSGHHVGTNGSSSCS